jgi:hypothetical protein
MNALRHKYKSYEEGLKAWLEANEAIYSEPSMGGWSKEDEETLTVAFQEMWNDPNLTELPGL